MSLKEQINAENLPQHVAIIMDGNGRWARQKGLDRTYGHREGVTSVRKVIEAASAINLSYVTLYTFSTENWKRPEEEVKALMALMVEAITLEIPNLVSQNVRLTAIGDIDRLPEATRNSLDQCMEKTSVCTGLTMILALSYSSRWEILNAAKKMVKAVQENNLNVDDVTESDFSDFLTTKGIPDPDLVVRTGGEKRISNYLLWQSAYAEFYFTDTLWPDFREDALYEAIIAYQTRERRFGKTSDQVTKS